MARLPLEGIRIIDLGRVFAVPYAGGQLADLGAEVIKIEGPGRIDTTRENHSAYLADNLAGADPWNRTSSFNMINRGKKSLVLDLSKAEGLAVLKDLIKVSDVFIENFTPRVMRRWGLDYPGMKQIKPDIVMVSNAGYGAGDGPYSQYPAQATTQEATHGLAHVSGYRDGLPDKAGQSYVDFLASWTCMTGVALGLRHRRRTGKGLWVDAGMYQLGCYVVGEYILDWQANQRLGGRIGNRHPWQAPQGCYPCAGNDQWCVIAVRDDADWAALCGLMGNAELATDARFATTRARIAQHDEIDAIITAWTKCRGKFAVMECVQGAGVPAGAVFDSKDVNLDRHYRSRGFLEAMQFPPERKVGKRVVIGRPWRLSKTPVRIKGPGPAFGQHNREVLQGILGYSDTQYAALEHAGIICARPAKAQSISRITMEERVRLGRLAYYDQDYKEQLGIQDPESTSDPGARQT